MVRMHRSELHRVGALTRIGRTLVIRGAGYEKWLNKNAVRVDGYDVAPNALTRARKVTLPGTG